MIVACDPRLQGYLFIEAGGSEMQAVRNNKLQTAGTEAIENKANESITDDG